MKNLYRGMFNLSREILIERAYAASERQSWLLFCHRIAKRRGVPVRNIMKIFDGSRPNYNITLEMKFEEDNEDETVTS